MKHFSGFFIYYLCNLSDLFIFSDDFEEAGYPENKSTSQIFFIEEASS